MLQKAEPNFGSFKRLNSHRAVQRFADLTESNVFRFRVEIPLTILAGQIFSDLPKLNYKFRTYYLLAAVITFSASVDVINIIKISQITHEMTLSQLGGGLLDRLF